VSTLIIQGSVLDAPDGSVAWLFDVRVPCIPAPEHRMITLAADAPFSVSLDGLTGINVIYLEADNPVTVVATSTAGAAQSLPAEFFHLVSREVPITAISLVRVAGQATTVRLILGQEA